ncbi:hypothetical protein KXD40_003551 [Peronospora effusa]|nr:hypothetical protein KXD40_003551 [Peronospora effusa]
MHLHFTTLCMAIAACRVSHSLAAPSRSVAKSPRSLREVPTKKHSGSDKLGSDEDERAGDIPGELKGIVGETSELLATKTKVVNSWDQLLGPLHNEHRRRELSTLLNNWDHNWGQISQSYEDELKKTKKQSEKVLMDSRKDSLNNVEITLIDANQKQQEPLLDLQEDRKIKDLKKFLNSRKPTAFESESESSTERLQAWLGNKGSVYILFQVLGRHKAMNGASNSLLISMNLERWNFVMKYLDNTGHYNFQDTLKETLTALCGNEERATLFLKHLFEEMWLMKFLPILDSYPKQGIKRQILGEIFRSWAYAKPPISPADVFDLFKRPDDPEFPALSLTALKTYLKSYKFGIQLDERSKVTALEDSIQHIYYWNNAENDITTTYLFRDRLNALTPNYLSKRKSESSFDDTRDRQRSRGK